MREQCVVVFSLFFFFNPSIKLDSRRDRNNSLFWERCEYFYPFDVLFPLFPLHVVAACEGFGLHSIIYNDQTNFIATFSSAAPNINRTVKKRSKLSHSLM